MGINKGRPILFSAPMVQAILDGRKAMTRRVVKPQPPNDYLLEKLLIHKDNLWAKFSDPKREIADGDKKHWVKSKYGQVGDHLWVRESYRHIAHGRQFGCRVQYDYKSINAYEIVYDPCPDKADKWRPLEWKNKPSIFMPRWASRITLEITNVRVERLQEITEEDADKEGVSLLYDDPNRVDRRSPKYKDGFHTLWNHINGKKYPWSSNPWVWVIEFKRLEQ